MFEYTFSELRFFTDSQIENLARKMNGKTFMKFQVGGGGIACNKTLTIRTDYDAKPEEIKNFFLSAALAELAR